MHRSRGIGILDSGVGGLTVASAVSKILPNENIFYFGDTAHVPYGDKSAKEIYNYVTEIIHYLKTKEVKAVVLACNTSSALVLPRIKDTVGIPIIGVIEQAAKMALQVSVNERIGVVANPLTVSSGAYLSAVRNISLNGTRVYQSPCRQWVPMIEAGKTQGEDVERIIKKDIAPLIYEGIDTLILGCTHYPYFIPAIKRVINNHINIIDPAESTALHLKTLLADNNLLNTEEKPKHQFYVSGNPLEFRRMGRRFFGRDLGRVEQVQLEPALV